MEASGTSGMKAAANGALNISIPDGWWCEAELLGENGWSIGRGEEYDDTRQQDIVESETFYDILEKEIAPMFYQRTGSGLPREWVGRVKTAIRTICPMFNSNRMLLEYVAQFYLPASHRRNTLCANEREHSLALTAWKSKVSACWDKIHVTNMESGPQEGLLYGSSLQVTAEVYLDELIDEDVMVEIYYGDVNRKGNIPEGKTVAMKCAKKLKSNVYRFEGAILCDKTGQQGFTVRVIPSHEDLGHRHETGLIAWALEK